MSQSYFTHQLFMMWQVRTDMGVGWTNDPQHGMAWHGMGVSYV